VIGLLVRCSECPLATMCSGQRRLKPARDFGPTTYWGECSALSRPRRTTSSRCQSPRRWARGRQGPSVGTAGSASVTIVHLPRQSPLGPGARARLLHQRRIRTAAPNGKQPSAHELPRHRYWWGACSSRRCVQWGRESPARPAAGHNNQECRPGPGRRPPRQTPSRIRHYRTEYSRAALTAASHFRLGRARLCQPAHGRESETQAAFGIRAKSVICTESQRIIVRLHVPVAPLRLH
jgi:hypothetical protein